MEPLEESSLELQLIRDITVEAILSKITTAAAVAIEAASLILYF